MGRVREKRRVEERRSERRKSHKKEDAGARKGRKVAKHCVFPMICGSGGSKSRLAKAAGAEPSGQMRDEKLHAVVARSTCRSQNVQKNTPRLAAWTFFIFFFAFWVAGESKSLLPHSLGRRPSSSRHRKKHIAQQCSKCVTNYILSPAFLCAASQIEARFRRVQRGLNNHVQRGG